MNFRCKFRHRRSIRRPRCPVRVQRFRDLATFSDNFYILYIEYPPYFYFRFVWPTDLRSIPQASTPTSIISTNFEVNMTIHCRVVAFFVCWYVTWRFDLEQLTYIACHVTNLATKFEDPTPICSWVMRITLPVGYHCKCVCDHCACTKSRDPWVGGQNDYIFGIPDPDLPIHYTTFIALRRRLRVVYSRVVQC